MVLAIVIIPNVINISKVKIFLNLSFLNNINNDINLEIKIKKIATKKLIEIGLIRLEKSNFNIDLKSLVIPQVLHKILKFSL
jgi:hypothetical protein